MRILGIDWGLNKFGLAIAEGRLAEPLKVIRYKGNKKLIDEIQKVVIDERVDKIVVGISEGESGKKAKEFTLDLSKNIKVPVETFDETLSSQEAQKLSRDAGIKRKKRKDLEDAYAATVMLQDYIDTNWNE